MSPRCLFGHDWRRDLLGMDGPALVWGVRCFRCGRLNNEWTVCGEPSITGMTEPNRWRQWWMTDDWVDWWQSLDHSDCGVYDMRDDLPMWQRCRDMHCPDCGKTTGSQGHINCPERKSS